MDKKLVANELALIAKLLESAEEHLDGFNSFNQLTNFYKKKYKNPKFTQSNTGYRVILPEEKRQHFYDYNPFTYTFKSEGYWDEHSTR